MENTWHDYRFNSIMICEGGEVVICNIYRPGDDRLLSRDNPGRGEVAEVRCGPNIPPSSLSRLPPAPLSQSVASGVRTDLII